MSYNQCLVDQWQHLTQGNQSVAKYITKFDEFLVKCGKNESNTVVLSIFRSGLRKDLRSELIVRNISTLEQAYQVVQDLDRSQDFSFTRSTDYKNSTNKVTTIKSQPNQSHLSPVLNLIILLKRMMIKAKKITVSHLDRFNKIDVLSAKYLVKDLVTLLYNVQARHEL